MAGKRRPAVSVGIAYLKTHLTVPVVDEVPRSRPAEFVKVVRVGGTKRNIVTDCPMLTFECWAPDEIAAEELCIQVADLLEDSPGERVNYLTDAGTEQAFITHHSEVGGPASN